MEEEQYQRKLRLINCVIDLYFDIEQDNLSPDMISRFMEWMDNGEYRKEKDTALFRKFSEICDKEEQYQKSFS